METQNSEKSPAAATEEAAATKNGGNATQEVSSTTQAVVEPTKRSLRVQTWKKMQENKLGIVGYNAIFNRIPGFVGNEKAAELLSEIDEFKKAKEIKVQIDRALHAAKLTTLIAGKNLYLPSTSESKAVYLKVDIHAGATEAEINEILNIKNFEKHRIEISLKEKVELDMVVVGSVVVSRDGYRIGRGNGFNDLDIGLLIEIGSITSKTVIATMVHDEQVVDNLPTNLFQRYDTPVDLIITPTEVIRVANRLPRPSGIYWELLSERRLKIVPSLQVLKETQEEAGKVIALKDEDTDIEQNQHNRNRRRFFHRRGRFNGGRRYQRRTISQNNADKNNAENNDGQQQQPKRNPPRRRRFINRRRRPTKSEGDQSGVESKSQDRKFGGGGDGGGNRKQKQHKNRPVRDFSIKLTNITRDVRIKDLKSELRNRQCNPVAITWKGQFGRCFLHFGNRNGEPSTEDDMNKVLQALADLSLTITPSEDNAAATAAVATNGEGGDVGDQKQPPSTGETADATEKADAADATEKTDAADATEKADAAETADAAQTADAEKTAVAAEAAPKTPKVVVLKVELIRYSDKANNSNKKTASAAVGDVALNGGENLAAGGDASSARIESVDTTTV